MVGRSPTDGVAAVAARFAGLLPPLLLAVLCLRVAELSAGLPAGAPLAEAAGIAGRAFAEDAYAFARLLPLLFLLSWGLLRPRSDRPSFWGLGLLWSLFIAVQAALVQYFITARVPLGADLYSYSLREVRQTASAGLRLYPAVLVGTLLALLILWAGLARSLRQAKPPRSPRV